MNQSILVAYQFQTDARFGMSYGRYVAGDPLADNLKPSDVLTGKAIDIIREARTKASDLGQLLGYRQIFSGPAGVDLLTPIGAKAAPELVPYGFHMLDLRDEKSRKLKWEVNTRIRDKLGPDALPDLVDYGAYVLEEMNSPWIEARHSALRLPSDVLIEDLEHMAQIWGGRLCVNIGGASADAQSLLHRAGELTDASGEHVIVWVRQDALGRVWKNGKSTGPGESWSSQYRQRRDFFGRDWLGATFEVNGHSGQWPELGVNIAEAYQTFRLARGVFFADVGGTKCTSYRGWNDFEQAVAARATTAVPALAAHIEANDRAAGRI